MGTRLRPRVLDVRWRAAPLRPVLIMLALGGLLAAQGAVDVQEFGVKADFRRLAVTLVGRVATADDAAAFSADDVGKVLVITGARSHPAYSTAPFALNAVITAVDGGAATIDSPDIAQAVDVAQAPAFVATNNVDAIRAALAHCAANGIRRLELGYTGTAYASPYFTPSFRTQAGSLDNGQRALFTVEGDLEIVGRGAGTTRIKVGCEDTPSIDPAEHWGYDVFALANAGGTPGVRRQALRDFTLEGADRAGTALLGGVAAFRTSYVDDQAMHVVFERVDIVGKDGLDVGFQTSRGGRWDASGQVVDFCQYEIRGCTWTVNCPLSVFAQAPNGIPVVHGAKKLFVADTVFDGGGTPIMRKFEDAATTTGDVLTIAAPGFSFYDYDSYIPAKHRQPVTTLEQAVSTTITELIMAVGVDRRFRLAAPIPATASHADLYVEDVQGHTTVIPQCARTEAGSDIVHAISQHPGTLFAAGNRIRVVYGRVSCQVERILTPTSARVRWLGPAQDLAGVSAILNDDGRVAEGHAMYIHPNVSCRFSDVTIANCLKQALHHYSGGGVRGSRLFLEFDRVAVLPTSRYLVERGADWVSPIELSMENCDPLVPVIMNDCAFPLYQTGGWIEAHRTRFLGGQCGGGLFDRCTGSIDVWGTYATVITGCTFEGYNVLRPNTPDLLDVVVVDSVLGWLAVGDVRSLQVSDSRIGNFLPSDGSRPRARLHDVVIGNGDPAGTIPAAGPLPDAGLLRFSEVASSAPEDVGTATIAVERLGGTSGAVGVAYATVAGASATATAGADHAVTSGTLAWADGDSAVKTFTVAIVADGAREPDERVAIALSAAVGGAALAAPAAASLTIVDDD